MANNDRGRPVKYTKETFARKLEQYIQERKFGKERGPLTKLDFCVYAGVNKGYISEHDLGDKSKDDFSGTIRKLETEVENSLQYHGLLGKLNPTMVIFSLKNYGWKDTSQTELSGPNGAPVQLDLEDNQRRNILDEAIRLLDQKEKNKQNDDDTLSSK